MGAKTILVTGASSGLGAATARALVHAGHRVFAGARSFAGQAGQTETGLYLLPLDVTDAASIDSAVALVYAQAGPIDVLIHCAARIVLGSCEETGAGELRAVMETNFLGMAAVTRAVLPQMRAQGRGLIVPFSSINGLLATPFTGAYVASKHAIEGWAEALRIECRPFGIRVCVVRPGDHRSGSAAYRQRALAAETPDSPYAGAREHSLATIARDEAGGLYPDHLARIIARIVQSRRPPATRTVACIDQRLATWLHDLLPARIFAWMIRIYYAGRA